MDPGEVPQEPGRKPGRKPGRELGPELLRDLQAAGLYDPDAPDAPRRLELLGYLVERGATLDQMVEAEALGRLTAVAGDLAAFPPSGVLDLAEVARRAGVSADRLRRIRMAQGFSVQDGSLLPDFVVDDVAAFEAGAAVMGDEAILAFTRVLGASAARIAETGVGMFFGTIEPGLGPGATELERAQRSEVASAAFSVVPSILSHVLEEHFRLARLRALTTRPGRSGPLETVAIGFVDLVESTRWAEGLSLRQHSLALAEFERASWDAATGAGGRVVKLVGDEVMFVAPSAESACRIAVELVEAARDDPALPPARGAVGFGTVASRDGDYFGPLVNVVARCVRLASEGSVVATDGTRRELGPLSPFAHTDLGDHEVRGVEAPVRLHSVSSPPGAGRAMLSP